MSTYNLTINAAALNLGATSFAELVFRRATVTDTYTIVPEFKSRVLMTDGMASIRLPPTTPGSVYECLIYGELRQKLRVFFVMPEADALLHELDLWTAWPNADSQGGGRAKWGLITGTLSDQSDLQTALNGKANTAHTHTIGQVDGLQTALDGKSNAGHGHSMSDVAGLNSTVSDLQAADAALANDILGRIANTEKGAANGVTPLDAGSKVPAAYLPSFVDDVLEYADLAAFPVSGETGKIYTALDTNKVYRWSGTVYVEISASPGSTDAVPEGVTNKYFTESRVLNAVLTGISFASNTAITAADTVLAAFGKLQAQVNDRLSNLSTPSATGIALSMAKSGTLGQIRALIAGQDIDVSATGADGVTISTVGRTLRYWAESLGIYGANAYRLFKPVRQVADGDLRVSSMLGGLRSSDGATDYGVSFGNPDYADHTGTLGAGSLDLQVRKSAAANLPSGTACVAIGQDNKVTGSRNVAISAINGATTVSGNDNYYMGPIIGNAVTGGDMNYSYGGTRIVGGFNKVIGGNDIGGGFYGTITGNHNMVMTGHSTVTGDGNVVIAPSATHTASNGLVLSSCPVFYGQSLRPRNMVAVSVRSSDLRVNDSPGAQVVELYLGSMSGFNYDGSWNTLTSNGLAAGSTNVYVAGYDFFFTAYVTVFAPGYPNDPAGMFKFDGCVRNVSATPALIVNKTTLYNPDATKGDAQIVWSSGKLLIQVSATSGTGAQKVNGSAFLQCIEPGPAGGY